MFSTSPSGPSTGAAWSSQNNSATTLETGNSKKYGVKGQNLTDV